MKEEIENIKSEILFLKKIVEKLTIKVERLEALEKEQIQFAERLMEEFNHERKQH